MKEFLAYRLPGKFPVKQAGRWKKIDLQSQNYTKEEFIFSDFEGNNVRVFEANTEVVSTDWKPARKNKSTHFDKKNYLSLLEDLIRKMRENKVQKVVFSRSKQFSFPSGKFWEVFDELEKKYPDAFVYFLHSAEFGTWMGATPETLIERTAPETYKTMALAGTLPIGNEKWGVKEVEEHMLVAEYIQNTIEQNGRILHVSKQEERNAGRVKHLLTHFSFEMQDERLIPFVQQLHPTPAICGTPSAAALDLIHLMEGRSRSLYCGFIGVIGGESTHLFVNLRCMQCFDEKVDLYVGGGITLSSIPEKEWEETENKALTLQQILEYIHAQKL